MVFKHATEDDRCCYDLELRSADGTLLVAISDFMVKRMSHDVLDRDAQQGQASSLQQELEQAITPGEGGELISRLLVHPEISRIVISPLNFEYRFAQQGVFGTDPAQQESIQEKQDRPELSSGYIAPESAHELGLAELWRVALGIADIGVEDNFFELGGHSLMLTQLVSKAKKQLGLQVSLSRLFDKPTIKNWLSLAATSAPKPKTGPIKRVSRDGYKSSR